MCDVGTSYGAHSNPASARDRGRRGGRCGEDDKPGEEGGNKRSVGETTKSHQAQSRGAGPATRLDETARKEWMERPNAVRVGDGPHKKSGRYLGGRFSSQDKNIYSPASSVQRCPAFSGPSTGSERSRPQAPVRPQASMRRPRLRPKRVSAGWLANARTRPSSRGLDCGEASECR